MKVTVPLKYPVPLEVGHLIQIDVQRIRVRDRLAAQSVTEAGGSDAASSVALVASNTGLPGEIIGDLVGSDFDDVLAMIIATTDADGAGAADDGEQE